MKNRRWSVILPGLYIAICVLCIGFTALQVLLNPGKYELAGLIVVVLGLPWSFVFTILTAMFHASPWLIVGAFGFSCFLNGWLLHKFGKLFDKA